MKKLFLSTLTIFLFTATISTVSYAQASIEPGFEHSLAAVSLPSIVRLNEIKNGTLITKDAVNDKIQKSFNKSFNHAINDQWYFLNKNVFWVCFDNNGRYTRAAYSKGGTMLYAVIQASEQFLPKEDRRLINKTYVDYSITSASEVTSCGRTVWIVNLQSEDRLVVVRASDGSLDELSNLPLSKGSE